MTDYILAFLQRSGLRAATREKNNDRLKAYRRSIYFPEFLFELGLSGYKFFFPFPVPPDEVLCAMKLSALLSRQNGRDFYDVMFLMSQTQPAYQYLSVKCNIHNLQELKEALNKLLTEVNLEQRSKDFEHLLFQKRNSKRILSFKEFADGL